MTDKFFVALDMQASRGVAQAASKKQTSVKGDFLMAFITSSNDPLELSTFQLENSKH
jgi:hypothetical protein